MLSTVSPSSLSAPARRSEIAAILAAGIVRMKSRLAILDSEIANDPHKSPPACLELSPKSVLSVTNVATAMRSKRREWRRLGYRVVLYFIWLRSAEMAIERVAGRVQQGGHYIHENVVRRRYDRGMRNLFELYANCLQCLRVRWNSFPTHIGR